MIAKIKINRKSYTRKNGTAVKAASYFTEDKGKSGKTPAADKWYEHNVEMHWHKDQTAAVRRVNALTAHKGDALATARALQALANVTTDTDTARLAKKDADYFFADHENR